MLEPGEQIAPTIDVEQCIVLLEKVFGLKATQVCELNGYDDKNFKVLVGDDAYVLKVLNSLESRDLPFVEGQNEMLRFLGERDVCCPQLIATTHGEHFTIATLQSGRHVVRLLQFVHGKILHQVEGDWDLFYKAGAYIAHIDNLLEDFHHVCYDTHGSLWMLDSVPKLRQFLPTITDDCKRAKYEAVISEFEKSVLAIVDTLPRGIIHGDFNEQNVVVSDDGRCIVGILDFGDTQRGCYVYELAIAMTYMMIVSKKLSIGGAVLQGYLQQRKVSSQELGLLRICILARLSQSLVMGAYSAHLHPENAQYLLTTAVPGWTLFNEIYTQTNADLLETWLLEVQEK